MNAAVEELEKYRVELTCFCNRMLGSPDAEDAVQETFIRAVDRLRELRPCRSSRVRVHGTSISRGLA